LPNATGVGLSERASVLALSGAEGRGPSSLLVAPFGVEGRSMGAAEPEIGEDTVGGMLPSLVVVKRGSHRARPTRAQSPRGSSACVGGLVRRAGAGVAAGLLALGAGCSEPDPPRLVARVGCGVDDDLVDTLRVQARGDFPTRGGTQVLLSAGEATLAWGDLPVDAVTVEGLFGQTVEAVGRTARLADEGDIPVYFARVDGVCPVEDDAAPREGVAAAAGPFGDVLVVGGRDAEGRLLDEVLHLHDEEGHATLLSGRLPAPRVGHTLHALDERRFLVVGGASAGTEALDHVVVVDLEAERRVVGGPLPIAVDEDDGPARAHHAAARSPDGRILVVGGCKRVTPQGECMVDEDDADDPSVHGTGIWIEAVGNELLFRPGPELVVPRYGAHLSFQRDGVAFLAGGRDAEGRPVHVVERWRPDTIRFRRYGGEPRSELDDDLPVVGATVLEGGVVLLVMADGRIHWITEQEREEYRPWSGWCTDDGPCFADLDGPGPATRRGMLTLPGERVLADGVLLPVAGLGLAGQDVLDPFMPGPGRPASSDRRVDATPVLLADGSVLLVGGKNPDTGELAVPLSLRLRPELDGPDERTPEVDRAARGSLVAHELERAVLEGDTVRLLAAESTDARFPRVRAHARGFRSASFRFDVTVQVTSGEVIPYLVLEHGGVEALSVSLAPDGIQAHVRDPQERVQSVSCAPTGLRFDEAQVLRVEVRPEGMLLRQEGNPLGQCPITSEPRQWSVGVGASGSGEMLVYGLRLTRL